LAFLSPFSQTIGMTVVIPRQNISNYIFELNPEQITSLFEATKQVSKILEKAFDCKIGLVFEGNQVPHVHAKLYPMGQDYLGFINTKEGNFKNLDQIYNQIIAKL
jgi:histidine triad (HIT) family protein